MPPAPRGSSRCPDAPTRRLLRAHRALAPDDLRAADRVLAAAARPVAIGTMLADLDGTGPLLPAVLHLIETGRLWCDLTRPLDDATVVVAHAAR
jgi:hypothetical protein